MTSFAQLYSALRRKNLGQYGLLTGSCFFSVLLITAYSCMMQAPTVLSVLPEGGDSRKQVMMIFVLTAIGCGVFTVYAASLFFRYKSTETGIFLALGANRSVLRRQLTGELALIALAACFAGMALGAPLAYLVWQLFRLFIVDSAEMVLKFSVKSWLIPTAFTVFVFVMLWLSLSRFIRRTNIIDIIGQSRKSEPIRDVPRSFGLIGIALTAAGGLLGYLMPSFFIDVFHWYPPEGFGAIFYAPAIVGIYMILLHTVVNGWERGSRYKNIVTSSMMKFQGRQTVRNMLVVTVLVAGAFFASFYAPLLCGSGLTDFQTRSYDYFFHYRADQNMLTDDDVRNLADEMDVTITNMASAPAAILGMDGINNVETDTGFGVSYDEVYQELNGSGTFISVSAFNKMSVQNVTVPPGMGATVFFDDGTAQYVENDLNLITNPVTGKTLTVTPKTEPLRCTMLYGCRVLNDDDYAAMTEGLDNGWLEKLVYFNVENWEGTYDFANALFNEIVDRSDENAALFDGYDPVRKLLCDKVGEPYIFDDENLAAIGEKPVDYGNRDGTDFRMYWKYMPSFRILDKADMVRTLAVFLMLFVFISLLCFAAVCVILYTRSMTIALINRRVYEDLGKLGASRAYLYRSVRQQVSRVYFVPCLTGTLIMCGFYLMIIYFNDGGRFSGGEITGLIMCAGVVAAVSAVIYLIYRLTLKKVCGSLGIAAKSATKAMN